MSRRRLSGSAAFWLTLLPLAAGALAGDPGDSIAVRDLPSFLIRWERTKCEFREVAIAEGVAYARGWRHAEAIDIASGRTLWSISRPRVGGTGPILMDDRLAVMDRQRGGCSKVRARPGPSARYGSRASPPQT